VPAKDVQRQQHGRRVGHRGPFPPYEQGKQSENHRVAEQEHRTPGGHDPPTAWFGSAWLGSAWLGSAWFGSAWFGSAWFGSA
jgi:hypothetical protein